MKYTAIAFVLFALLFSYEARCQTTGSTQYWNGSIWTWSPNLFHNGSLVGVGTTSPGGKFEVKFTNYTDKGLVITQDNTSSCPSQCTLNPYFEIRDYDLGFPSGYTYKTHLIFTSTSRLGINTDDPLGKVHIRWGEDALFFDRFGSGTYSQFKFKAGMGPNTSGMGLRFQFSNDGGVNYGDALFLGNDGNVGIGTTSPTAKLYVNGNTFLNGATTATGLLTLNNASFVVNDGNANNFIVQPNGMIIARQIDVHLDPIIPDYVFHAAFNADSAPSGHKKR
ncbi:MAG: hypothetical protein M3Q97_00615 [Bacteroidota bacterium]|nr:hypothetical protein [Bacteroidota bacterium]